MKLSKHKIVKIITNILNWTDGEVLPFVLTFTSKEGIIYAYWNDPNMGDREAVTDVFDNIKEASNDLEDDEKILEYIKAMQQVGGGNYLKLKIG